MEADLSNLQQQLLELSKRLYRIRRAQKAGQNAQFSESIEKLKNDFDELWKANQASPKSSSIATKLKKDFENLKRSIEETANTPPSAQPTQSEQQVQEFVLVGAYNEQEEKARIYNEYLRDMSAIAEMSKELSEVVVETGAQIDVIEKNVDSTGQQIEKATKELKEAAKLQSSRLQWILGSSLSVIGGTVGILGGPVGIGLGAALGGYVGKTIGKTIENQERRNLDALVPDSKYTD